MAYSEYFDVKYVDNYSCVFWVYYWMHFWSVAVLELKKRQTAILILFYLHFSTKFHLSSSNFHVHKCEIYHHHLAHAK